MTFEERLEWHGQWLKAIESNQMEFAAGMVRLERKHEELQEQFHQSNREFNSKISQITDILLVLSERLDQLRVRVDQLTDTVDRYIRFRGDAQPSN